MTQSIAVLTVKPEDDGLGTLNESTLKEIRSHILFQMSDLEARLDPNQ